MSINPIWVREMRARWRGWRAFGLLLAYVAILGGVLLWRYNGFLHGYEVEQTVDPLQRFARLGHELFLILICLQAGLWMLFAPILSGTSITAERERGLMQDLHLSRLSARQIVIGKLLSALSFAALMLIVTLPITAICFLMGGVSPGEFFSAFALHASTAVAYAALGLAVSSWSRKSLEAMTVAIVLAVCWGMLTAFVQDQSSLQTRIPLPQFIASNFIDAIGQSNPVIAALEIVEPESDSTGFSNDFLLPFWVVSFGFNILSALFLILLATRGASKILGAPFQLEWSRFRRALHVPKEEISTTSNDPAELKFNSEKKAARRWELGFLARWQFTNPVLGREFRACFRPRSSSPITVAVAILLAPFAFFAYVVGIYEILFDGMARESIPGVLFGIYLILVIFLCAINGAGNFAREREQSTLTALRLSLLTPRELLIGKICTPLVVCAVCGLVFLPMILPAIRGLVYTPNMHGISLTQFVGAFMLLASTACCMTLAGLTFSWFNRRVVAATSWTLGTLFALFIGVPALLLGTSSPSTAHELENFFQLVHPFFSLVAIFERRLGLDNSDNFLYRTSVLGDALSTSLVLWFISAILLYILWRGVLLSRDRAD